MENRFPVPTEEKQARPAELENMPSLSSKEFSHIDTDNSSTVIPRSAIRITPEMLQREKEERERIEGSAGVREKEEIFRQKAQEESSEEIIDRLIKGGYYREEHRDALVAKLTGQPPMVPVAAPLAGLGNEPFSADEEALMDDLRNQWKHPEDYRERYAAEDLSSYDETYRIEKKEISPSSQYTEGNVSSDGEPTRQEREEYNVVNDVYFDPVVEDDVIIDDSEEWVTSLITDNEEDDKKEEVEALPYDVFSKYETIKAEPNLTIYRSYYKGQPVLTKTETKKFKIISDLAEFNKFINARKRQYRSKMAVPLVNSGIEIEFIGAGAFDYAEVYSIDPSKATIDDFLNRMKVMSNNIVGCEPRVSPNKILSTINFMDYQLANFGFIAATVPQVSIPMTCENCHKEYIVEADTCDLIINADELDMAWKRRLDTPSQERATEKVITIEIQNGYAEFVFKLASMEKVRRDFTTINQAVKAGMKPKIQELATILTNIEKVRVDNVEITSPILIFNYLNTLDHEIIEEISTAQEALTKNIVVPKFGFKVKCASCGYTNEVPIDDMDSLAFFHLSVKTLQKVYQNQNTKNG